MTTFLATQVWWVTLAVIAGSFVCTWVLIRIAHKTNVLDHPHGSEGGRKQHKAPTPLMGGVAIYSAFAIVLLLAVEFLPEFTSGYLLPKHVYGFLLGGFVLVVGGVIDDIWDLSPRLQILFPVAAALSVVASGIGIDFLTNPFGTGIDLTFLKLHLFSLEGRPYFFVVFADLFAFLWILGSIYATKFLDGVDGLVSGLTVIAGVVFFGLSVWIDAGQPETAFIALMLAAATLGFLVWNLPLPRARIFLGEGGSTLLGFLLAVLAILSGAKLATALLLLGLPLVDLILVIGRRLLAKKSPFQGDRRHTHFQLLALFRGSIWRTLLTLWGFVLVFGVAALLFEGRAKGVALILALFVAVLLGIFVVSRSRT
ncbi:MAG: undecaprenyl/decaprenyl-phosphate alpha-N-acetylglucosaminyl 1-phosphate transferase [Candidatus Doudnabacteria bacterium]|nr:undecaprenyl/decaprenyl-phosphate alpha-N-acetylglucosaminyl 1-phosphate transferase [Candidatus Doudnabacteria bacterium]